MPFRKNADGIQQYYYKKDESKQKIIQKDLFKGHGYKRDTFPPQFFENVEKTLKRGYWAYAIDGDGCINRRLDGKNKELSVAISLTDPEPVQELADIYGTSISRTEFLTESWATVCRTKLSGKRALHFLRLICPYMTEKRKKATQAINMFDPNYHPPKISMNFRQNPDLLKPHMESVGGFFDTEGSVGIKIRNQKKKTKKLGEKIYSFLDPWLKFDNTDIRPLRKLKKLLETWPFTFKPTLSIYKARKQTKSNGENVKTSYTLHIPQPQHLLFMKMFSPFILITRKREYADRFELKKKIYEICGAGK